MNKLEKLSAIYRCYAEKVADYPYVCEKGCSSCCTQSVTMTGLEGIFLLDYIKKDNIALPDSSTLHAGARPVCTTNEFAARCLAEEAFEPEEGFWSFEPCVFLQENACTVYAARPFGCRSFGSFVRCGEAGEAELPSLLITLNTVVMQVIEHLDQGGVWGNMLDVLFYMRTSTVENDEDRIKIRRQRLLATTPLPGFLVPPEETREIEEFLEGCRL